MTSVHSLDARQVHVTMCSPETLNRKETWVLSVWLKGNAWGISVGVTISPSKFLNSVKMGGFPHQLCSIENQEPKMESRHGCIFVHYVTAVFCHFPDNSTSQLHTLDKRPLQLFSSSTRLALGRVAVKTQRPWVQILHRHTCCLWHLFACSNFSGYYGSPLPHSQTLIVRNHLEVETLSR